MCVAGWSWGAKLPDLGGPHRFLWLLAAELRPKTWGAFGQGGKHSRKRNSHHEGRNRAIGRIWVWEEETSSMTAVAQAGCVGIMMRAVMMGESKTRHLWLSRGRKVEIIAGVNGSVFILQLGWLMGEHVGKLWAYNLCLLWEGRNKLLPRKEGSWAVVGSWKKVVGVWDSCYVEWEAWAGSAEVGQSSHRSSQLCDFLPARQPPHLSAEESGREAFPGSWDRRTGKIPKELAQYGECCWR